jgi:hypothetical protein
MRIQIIHPHRLKRPCAHVQCYKSAVYAHRFNVANEPGIEVQTRRGRGDCTPLASENTLVALAVIRVGGSVNVRWKRYIAPPLEEFKRRPRKFDTPKVILPTEDSHDSACSRHFEPVADGLAGTQLHERLVFYFRDDTLEEDFDAAA